MLDNSNAEALLVSDPLIQRLKSHVPLQPTRPKRVANRLLACIGDRESAPAVAAHAAAIAPGLGLAPVLAAVIDSDSWCGPVDPVGWQTRRFERESELKRLGREFGLGDDCNVLVETGRADDTLARIGQRIGASLTVVAKRDKPVVLGLGTTANSLLELADGAVLLVPPAIISAKVRYRRILVPIDGSARADSALPVAQRIALDHGAELRLVHVVPALTVVNEDHSPQMRALRDSLASHNRRELELHMRALQVQLARDGVNAHVQIAGPGDPRIILRQLLDTEGADLLVMTSHGVTGIDSLACGSVTHFMVAHPKVPVLVLRPDFHCDQRQDMALAKSAQSTFTFN